MHTDFVIKNVEYIRAQVFVIYLDLHTTPPFFSNSEHLNFQKFCTVAA